jgi:hypothetical protein
MEHLLKLKYAFGTLECAYFSFNKCSIYNGPTTVQMSNLALIETKGLQCNQSLTRCTHTSRKSVLLLCCHPRLPSLLILFFSSYPLILILFFLVSTSTSSSSSSILNFFVVPTLSSFAPFFNFFCFILLQ